MNTILLVEDSLTESGIITQCLYDVGLRVILSRSVEEAQKWLEASKPDLIILDVILPGQSGFELCVQLKKSPEMKSIPVVLCSTKKTEGDKIWGTMLGADAYVTKPVNMELLVQTVKDLINKTRMPI